jgi:hypothetical protein
MSRMEGICKDDTESSGIKKQLSALQEWLCALEFLRVVWVGVGADADCIGSGVSGIQTDSCCIPPLRSPPLPRGYWFRDNFKSPAAPWRGLWQANIDTKAVAETSLKGDWIAPDKGRDYDVVAFVEN